MAGGRSLSNLAPPPWVSRAQTATSQKKKILAVEGKNDVAVYRAWIEKVLGQTWANLIQLENAENRPKLLSGLRWLNDNNDPAKDVIFGLADRDEWDSTDVSAMIAKSPNLLVNQSRHSLESYFCDPDELESILLARDAASGKQTFAGHLTELKNRMESKRHDFVRHWALGCVIQRANESIRNDAKYPTFFRDTCPLPSDHYILSKLTEWANLLEPNRLFSAFKALRDASLARPISEQFRECVEPKLFFGQVVLAGPGGLNSIRRQESSDWMIELARWSPDMPADLKTTLAPVIK